jgi:SAM-dependent methyltransferase
MSRLYRRADLVRVYSLLTLHPPEATILVRYREDVVGRRVLDRGCGAGRLATYLRPLAGHSIGVDFPTARSSRQRLGQLAPNGFSPDNC